MKQEFHIFRLQCHAVALSRTVIMIPLDTKWLRLCGFCALFLVRFREQNQCGRARGKKKQTQKEKQHHIPWQPIYRTNQQNLDTQLATAKLLLAIHSARNSAEVKSLHSDCLTVKQDPLRKHVQPQINYDHGSFSAWRPTV